MKITLKNIGPLKFAEYELADLTIICGENNTGKTYATYALYGFINYWKKYQWNRQTYGSYESLMETGTLRIPLIYDQEFIDIVLAEVCEQYSKEWLYRYFATKKENFTDAEFLLSIKAKDLQILDTYEKKWQSLNGNQILEVLKESERNELLVNLLTDKSKSEKELEEIERHLNESIAIALQKIIYDQFFPNVFIASAERTNAVIFKNELNFRNNNIARMLTNESNQDLGTMLTKLFNSTSGYPLPIYHNVEFVRNLEEIAKNNSYIFENHPEILQNFSKLIGGTYTVQKNGLYHIPNKKKIKLDMGESSSSVRALLIISFYLYHIAQKGDLLIIDEPELNLHPVNQRKIARLFAVLINMGIKILITTHSDYIIKELNSLIMIYGIENKERRQRRMKDFSYTQDELINPQKIKFYTAKKTKINIGETTKSGKSKKSEIQTLVAATINSIYGIEAESFDQTIDQMNKIQQAIIFGS